MLKPTALRVLCLALASISLAFATLIPLPALTRPVDGHPHIILSEESGGRYILGFGQGMTEHAARQMARTWGLEAGVWLRSSRALQVGPVTTLKANWLAPILAADSRVAFLEPDMQVHALFTPDDTRYHLQWAPDIIGAEDAWTETLGSASIVVAVVDTGVDKDHEDINGKTTVFEWNYVAGNGDASDDNGHGTHVAGVVGAHLNNELGVASIGGNTMVMPLKVLNSSGSGSFSNMAAAIEDAADEGAHIVTLSSGSEFASTGLRHAINYAHGVGVLLVAASGNNGSSTPFYPAAYTATVAVGSTNSNDERASSSNYGDWLDMVAPGVGIQSTWCCSGNPPPVYINASGTSHAAPHVAAVAALMLALDTGLTNDELREILTGSATDVGTPGPDIYTGSGRLHAGHAVQTVVASSGAPTPTPLPTDTSTPSPTPTFTPTPLPSDTPTAEPTATETPLPSDTPTPLPTDTPTPLPTETYTPSPTATDTPLPTNTNTPTASATPTSTPTPTPRPGRGGRRLFTGPIPMLRIIPLPDAYLGAGASAIHWSAAYH